MAIIAIFCLVGGLIYAPFSPIPNGFNNYTTRIVTFGSIEFPVQLVYHRLNATTIIVGCPHTADLTFILSGDVIVSGKLLDIRITMDACPVFAEDVVYVWVEMENALETLGVFSRPVVARVVMEWNDNASSWVGSHKVIYLVSGTFTATVAFYLRNTTTLHYPTGALFPIDSPEIIMARQNEALTTSLSFFVLMFAAVEVRVESHQRDSKERNSNSAVHNQGRDEMKRTVRLVKGKVATDKHADRPEQH